MKIDPYKHKEKFQAWKEKVAEKGISDISKANSDIILKYISDMELGLNVSVRNVKGSRSYTRLNTLRQTIILISKLLAEKYSIQDITKLDEEQTFKFFNDIRTGIIRKQDGGIYKSPVEFVKTFKAFWHWWQKINRKKKIEIPDITVDLDTRKEKPSWVYLDYSQIKKLCNNAKFEYSVLMTFLYDTGIRSPTELVNIRISDISLDFKELNIREEISKTFGRRIKLMVCSDLLKEYVSQKGLSSNDQLFAICPPVVNRYLQRLAKRVLGEGQSLAGQKYSQLTMYDFRHCSCCYWLPRYKSESALKYRFGWKKSDKIHYYSELLGMKDTISEEDLLVDVTKTEIEKRLQKSENENEMLKEKIFGMEDMMKKILEKQMQVIPS